MMNKKGFTLIELIVILAIIGVLAAIVIPVILGYGGGYRYEVKDQNGTSYYTDDIEYDGNRAIFVDQYGHSHVLTSYSIEELR